MAELQIGRCKVRTRFNSISGSYFHFFNKNLNGARSMMKKCLTKFEPYQRVRGVDVISLKTQIISVQNYFNEIEDTSIIKDSYIIMIKVSHERYDYYSLDG